MESKKEPLGLAIIILLYFALKPLYLGASGYLQISDVVLLVSMVYLFFDAPRQVTFTQKSFSIIRFYVILIFYQVVVNAIWSIITNDRAMSRHSLYYIFNFIAFAGVVYIGQRTSVDSIKRAIGLGSVIAVTITAVGLLFFGGEGSRSTGFFNNPNQLGYFSVIILTVIALCREQLNRLEVGILFVISFWATILSLSKAAIIAYFAEVIILIIFYQNDRSLKRVITEFVLLSIVAAAIYFFFFSDNNLVIQNPTLHMMRLRIINMSEENDSGLAYGRGYARVGEILPNILWGTGEGAYNRFIAKHGTEVHSTFISLLTCYGVIGLMGYLALFKKCMGCGKHFLQNSVVLLGLFLYSLSHNGIRNTLLWMLMAMLFLDSNIEGFSDSNYTIRQ